MVKRILFFIIVFSLAVTLSACGKKTTNQNTNSVSAVDIITGVADVKIKEKADKDMAIGKAKELWRAKYLGGEDLSAGPCLSNDLIPDWVADIAYNPRQAVDDLPENQCSAFREGKAHHFVELDPEGNVIRTY